ncbi:PBP1A family penicillin-binding protein [Allofustis seminis]|uniref:PBP1A family penicillin-binding protein n=1 Tax=Allofustis seminis TaxID=166939 RepID=UPI000376EA56|nr:PBP1A family penicillin-binding protein [Allofustis seminis]
MNEPSEQSQWKAIFNKLIERLKVYSKIFWRGLRRFWYHFHMTKVLISLFLTLSLLASMYLGFLAKTADVETLKQALSQTTTIVDEDGDIAGHLQSQKGTYVPLAEISPAIQDAVLSTEDRRFYDHPGFDIFGIGRAVAGIILKGEIVGGGSTLTQQLAKNAFLTADQTLVRKLKELFLAIEIEKQYSKDTILEMYLNHAYFGTGVWGVEDASLRYFGQHAEDLDQGNAAVLAAILKAPTQYNPIDNYDNSIERRNLVLDLMVQNEKLSAEDAADFEAAPITLQNAYEIDDSYTYPYYFDAVIDEAVEKYKFDEHELMNGGYTIYTALNQNYQKIVENTFDRDELFERADDGTKAEGASVVLKPQTGGIQAVVGGNGEYNYRGFNRATQMYRQPSSTIKPLSVYGPALEAGYRTDSLVKDELKSYGDTKYTPENYDFEYDGELPMYEAVARSKNTSAVWLLNEIGIDKGFNKIKQLGLHPTEEDYHLGAIALGGMSEGVTPVELASAYSTFANNGVRNAPHFITKIVDAKGRVVVNHEVAKSKRIYSEAINKEINQLLVYVFDHPQNIDAEPSGYDIAGKTGTSEVTWSESGAANQWIVGYTPDVVVVAWTGYDKTDEDHYLRGYNISEIGQVLRTEMAHILPYTPVTPFGISPIVPNSPAPPASENSENDTPWQEEVEKGAKKAEEFFKDATEKIKESTDKIKEGIDNIWKQIFP